MSMIILFLKEIADLQSPSDGSNSLSLPQRHWRSTWEYARYYITFTWRTDYHSFQQNGGQNRAKWVWTEIEIRHKRPGIIKLVCYWSFWIVNCLKLEASLFWEWISGSRRRWWRRRRWRWWWWRRGVWRRWGRGGTQVKIRKNWKCHEYYSEWRGVCKLYGSPHEGAIAELNQALLAFLLF